MRWIRRSIGVILAGLAVILLTISACTVGVRSAFFNPDTYKDAFENQNFYREIIPLALPAILQSAERENNNSNSPIDFNNLSNTLSPEDWQIISDQLIPADWLQRQVEGTVDVVFLAFEGDFSGVGSSVDFDPVIRRLSGDTAFEVAEYVISVAPDCSPQQERQLADFTPDNDLSIPLCNPPDNLLPVSQTLVTSWLNQLGDLLDQQRISLDEIFGFRRQDAQAAQLLAQLQSQITLMLYLCPLALIALIVTLLVRTLKGFGRWIGSTSLVSGGLLVVVLIFLQLIVIDSFTEIFRAPNDIERFQAELSASFFRSMFSNMSGSLLLQAGLFIAIGFILITISVLRHDSEDGIPRGSVIVTEDGQIISTASRPVQSNDA